MPETLVLGQIANSAAPATAAAEVYFLSDGYGSPVGDDTPLLVETNDVAPAGQGGRFLLRRGLAPIRYAAGCSIRSTLITDFVRDEAAQTKVYASPPREQEDVIEINVARPVTTVRARLEVTQRSGRVTIFTPSAVGKGMTTGAPFVVETA